MHPLNTLIQTQRHQVRQQPGRPTPRRRSETEENAIVRNHSQQRSPLAVALTAAVLFTTALLLATLALA